MSVTIKNIKATFDSCEKMFDSCWRTLDELKHYKSGNTKLVTELILFQERLAFALFDLQKVRNGLTAEMRRLVDRKKTLNLNWFNMRMKSLASFSKGIQYAINMGKALGDAYAFYFYRSNLDLLEKQFFHQKISGFVSGTGGAGEMAFIKGQKHIDGKFTIYHGITNILRYGDFSFYDLKTHEITEIGEMKSRRLDEKELEISLTLISTKTTQKPIDQIVSEIKEHDELDQKTRDKLKRQIDEILKILKPVKGKQKISSKSEGLFYFKEIEELYAQAGTKRPSFKQASEGLLFSGIKLPKASLFTRIFNRKIHRLIKNLPDNVIEPVKRLMKEGSTNNGLVIGQLLYNPDYNDKNTPGTIPLFWYPIKSSLLKDLYFNQLIILSFFNPAHLIEQFHQHGYHVDSKYLPSETRENSKGYKKGLKQFDLFVSYIMNYLQAEHSVIMSVLTAEKMLHESDSAKSGMIKPQFIFDNLFQIN